MTKDPRSINRLHACRTAAGLTQAALASRAGISRTAVTAIEAGRTVPSVAAALGLAKALGTTVEELFGPDERESQPPAWAWSAAEGSQRFWTAEVSGRQWMYPADTRPSLTPLPDSGAATLESGPAALASLARETLVVAGCDPAAGLLASEYARASGMRMLVLPRSSRQSLDLLQQGKVHVAGLHLATRDEPERNARLVRDSLGRDFELLRVVRWQEGIATAPALRIRSVRGALQSKLRWVGREPGSGARLCLDRLLGSRAAPRHLASHHRGVAEAIRDGWADAGVCVRLASAEAGLGFLPVQEEVYDLCIPRALLEDPRLQALVRVIRSQAYRGLLGQLPGYDAVDTGELRAAE